MLFTDDSFLLMGLLACTAAVGDSHVTFMFLHL